MSLVLQVTRSSTPINVNPDQTLSLTVVSGNRLYYSDTPFLTASSNKGYIDPGGSHTFTDDEFWVLSAGTSYIDLEYASRASGIVGGGTATYKNVIDYGADPTGVIDSTTSFNLALAAGSAFVPDGTYKILGGVSCPPEHDFLGAGRSSVTLKLGVGGQIATGARTVNTSAVGGYTGGFTVDGQNIAQPSGSIFYVGFCNKRRFEVTVFRGANDNVVIETAQNCTWDSCHIDGAARSNVVFDYGAGGHAFYNPEISSPGRHSVEFRQTGQSAGGYPTFLGPSNNTFYGGICEYGTATSTYALIYHGAGTNNQFTNFSSCPTGRTVAGAAAVKMEVQANAVTTTCTVTSGSSDITVANATGITPLMGASVPGFPAGSVVANVVGNVVTMFGTATASYAAGTACGFGAQSNSLQFDGLVSPGSSGYTYGIEMKGNTSITLSGRSTFTNHIAAFRTYSNDRITITGPISYFGGTSSWVAHPNDDTGASGSFDLCVRSAMDAGLDIRTAGTTSARGLTLTRSDQGQPNTIMYPSQVLFSDGTFSPSTTGVGFYLDPADSLHYLQAASQLQTSMVKVTGAAGATVDNRFFGRRTAAGPPPSGTWKLGDWIIDSGGSVWVCTVAGTPGTWSSGSRPTYTAPSFAANVSNYSLGDPCGSAKGADNRVLLRGAVITSASFAANSTVATITAAHRPSSAIVLGTGVLYTAGGALSTIPISVDSSGLVQPKVALGSGDAVFLDCFNYHAA